MTITATPEAEGAQALFCYIADVLGAKTANKEFDTYLDKKSKKDFITFQTEYKDITVSYTHLTLPTNREV